ncbi:MAG TPA: LamG domain-containing protein [Kofleriaceae bacterium]|nr:LamG domain-containing protein [Kofleriaceae bacterium]
MRRVAGSLCLVVSACNFEHGELGGAGLPMDSGGDVDAPDAPWRPGFLYRKPIAITPPSLTAALTSFPVAILTTADAQLGDNARTDGRDITFTAADGTTLLDHELVTFDGASGALEAWVRIPTLPNGTTTIFMYYGAGMQPLTAIATWPSQFKGIWHLDAGIGAADSTPNGHGAFSSAPLTTPTVVDGIAGHARAFDGIDDSMTVTNPADGSLDFGTTSFSFSLWVNVAVSKGAFDAPIYKGGASVGDPGYCVLLGTADWNMKTHDGTSYRDPAVGAEALGAWVYLAGVMDRDAQQMLAYRDGVFTDMMSTTGFGSITNNKALVFGPTGTLNFQGTLDEVRISAGALSPEWIATEYANLETPGFVALGSQQMKP